MAGQTRCQVDSIVIFDPSCSCVQTRRYGGGYHSGRTSKYLHIYIHTYIKRYFLSLPFKPNAWLLSGLAVLSAAPHRIESLFPTPTDECVQTGVHAVKFCCDGGKWQTIIVDDYVPCDASNNTPIYSRCKDPSEMWVPLIEKAAAKFLAGKGQNRRVGYGVLCEESRVFSDAMRMFSEGVTQRLDLDDEEVKYDIIGDLTLIVIDCIVCVDLHAS